LLHHWVAKSVYKIHSPFVYDFYIRVLKNRGKQVDVEKIEASRRLLLNSNAQIDIEDFGAGKGGKAKKFVQRRIKELAEKALKPAYLAQILGRIVEFSQPQFILELGTCFGITTAYFASYSPSSIIYTLEGSKSIAEMAKDNFKKLSFPQIKVITGNFDTELPKLIPQMKGSPKLYYIDGNHRLEPTLNYFHQLLAVSTEDDIFIFDDIHWSIGMETAWKTIKNNDQVYLSLDLFYFGIVFLKRNRAKEHFVLRVF
jgi:predicted O-methyltransferase YrrM